MNNLHCSTQWVCFTCCSPLGIKPSSHWEFLLRTWSIPALTISSHYSHSRSNQAWQIGFDNVQNYLYQCDTCNGHENTLNIGIAVTYIKLEDIDPKAFDLDDKWCHLKENKHWAITVDQLHEFIDCKHLEIVGTLQWLHVLAQYIPELQEWKKSVNALPHEGCKVAFAWMSNKDSPFVIKWEGRDCHNRA